MIKGLREWIAHQIVDRTDRDERQDLSAQWRHNGLSGYVACFTITKH